MRLLHRLRSLAAVLFRRDRFESTMSDEIRFHLDAYVDELMRAGVPRDEAWRRARVEFGGVESVKEECRQARGLQFFDELGQDVRYGLRSLRRSPGFTSVAVAVLGIGIGVTTAVFSIVNGILLERFPYQDPEQLVLMYEYLPNAPSKFGVSPPDFESIRDEARSYSGMAAFQNVEYELAGVAESRRLVGARVSPELFSVLGVPPAVGRALTGEDDRQNGQVAVLSDGLWSRVFGRDPSSVGRTILLDRQPYTVIGIMPQQFEFPPRGADWNGEPAEVFVPISFSSVEREGFGMRYNNTVVARLKPGVSIEQARSEAASLVNAVLDRYPGFLQGFLAGMSIPIVTLSEETVGGSRRLLLVLMGAVALVLLIVCADVANLLLTRSGSRRREIVIRSSLGASPIRILRQLLTESFTLAILGTTLGLLLAYAAMQALLSLAGETLPRAESIAFDSRVLVFAVLLALVTPLLFGSLPAIRTVLGTDAGTLKDSARTSTLGRSRFRMLGTLVVVQFAIALVLSVGAGLLIRSFLHLLETDPGFRPEQVVRVTMTLPSGRYASGEQVRSFYDRSIEAAGGIPGVLMVGAGNDLPLSVRERRAFSAEGAARAIPETSRLIAPTWTSPGYFEALGVPLKKGRFFTESDHGNSQLVVIINEAVAQMLWPGEDAIGRRIKWGIDASQAPWMSIVGVVGNVKQSTLNEPTMAQVYVPLSQESSASLEAFAMLFRTVNLVVRSSRDRESLIADLRGAVQRLDPELPISKAEPLTEMIGESLRPQRFSMTVVMFFALIALVLAGIGIYGVLANVVTQQTHEIGIRMALGATAGRVRWMVLRRGLVLMVLGIGLGIPGSLAVTRLMADLLYEVRPTDAVAFFCAALVLASLALLASLAPAWRATRVDPLVALKME